MQPLKDRVAVVAGASRGAGRGIALALGEAGATVYVLGRTTRGGPKPRDGAPGTVEDTAEEVTARGGVGVPVRADCTSEEDVAAAFDRVRRERGRVDVLANAVWGASDGAASAADLLANWGRPFWEQPTRAWRDMISGGPYAYFLTSWHALRLMAESGKGGLIAGLTDGVFEGAPEGEYGGQLLWELAHHAINRMHHGIAAEARPHGVAVVTLMPGFMRTERVLSAMTSEELKKQFGFDRSESVEYVGRAVAALAADPKVIGRTGKILFVADLAREYGFTDVDGRQIPRFNPFG